MDLYVVTENKKKGDFEEKEQAERDQISYRTDAIQQIT